MSMTFVHGLSWFIVIFLAREVLSGVCQNCANGVDSTGGCLSGWYGHSCGQPCMGNCSNNTCNVDTGICLICHVGNTGSFCNDTCPQHCDSTGCEMDGTCRACKGDASYGNRCTEICNPDCYGCFQKNGSCVRCQTGLYGMNCEYACSDKCNSTECDKTGHCSYGCADPQFCGKECDIACSSNISNCEKCISPYGNLQCLQCSGAKFGRHCENDCPDNCELCNSFSRCTKCITGFSGTACDCKIPNCLECNIRGYCKKCKPGLFGEKCDKACPGCKTCKTRFPNSKPICLSCKEGLFLNYIACLRCPNSCTKCISLTECLECIPGYFGKECTDKCPINCLPDSTGQYICEGKRGTCSGDCRDGFYGEFCNLPCVGQCNSSSGRPGCNKLSGMCVTCSDGYYGHFCNLTCSPNCSREIGRDICERNTGTCTKCQLKSYGSTCEKHCPINCLPDSTDQFKMCDRMTGTCSEDCRDGFYGDFCNLPCIEQCSSSSRRSVCNKLSGQCLTCRDGFYGQSCNLTCSSNCSPASSRDMCERNTGTCASCRPMFYGSMCEKHCPVACDGYCNKETGTCDVCISKHYGKYCSRRCPEYCGPAINSTKIVCHRLNAECLHCKVGFYGERCQEYCAINCAVNNNVTKCEKTNGLCKGCTDGFYGKFCESICEHCKGQLCDQDTGQCKSGCETGWFNMTCTVRCSINCRGQECDQRTGLCLAGCVEGFRGQFCKLSKQGQRFASLYELGGAVASVVLLSVSLIVTLAVIYKRKSIRRARQIGRGIIDNSLQDPTMNTQSNVKEVTPQTMLCGQESSRYVSHKQRANSLSPCEQVNRISKQSTQPATSCGQQSLRLHQNLFTEQPHACVQKDQQSSDPEKVAQQSVSFDHDQENASGQRIEAMADKRKDQENNLNQRVSPKVIPDKQKSKRNISIEEGQVISRKQIAPQTTPCNAYKLQAFPSTQRSKRTTSSKPDSDSRIPRTHEASRSIHNFKHWDKQTAANIRAAQRTTINETDDEKNESSFIIAF